MRVLIVDDHAMVRDGMRLILRQIDPEAHTECAEGVDEALAKVFGGNFDLVILDLSLKDGSGFSVLEKIVLKVPKIPVIIVSMHTEDHYAIRAFSLGADGYLTKGCPASELICAVQRVIAGGKYISERHTTAVVEGLRNVMLPLHQKQPQLPLSAREREVAQLLVSGASNKEIAWQLALNVKTVSTYKMRILKKTHTRNQADLIKFALSNKWPPD